MEKIYQTQMILLFPSTFALPTTKQILLGNQKSGSRGKVHISCLCGSLGMIPSTAKMWYNSRCCNHHHHQTKSHLDHLIIKEQCNFLSIILSYNKYDQSNLTSLSYKLYHITLSTLSTLTQHFTVLFPTVAPLTF